MVVTGLLHVSFLIHVLSISLAEVCRDAFPASYCQEKRNFCYLSFVKHGCMKSCDLCIEGPVPSCGTTTTAQSRVIGGKAAKPGKWPWQAGIRIKGRYACGGALISPQWIVTAARCVNQFLAPGNYSVILGASNMMVVEKSWQKRKVTKIIRHPRHRLVYYDIALLKMDKPVLLNKYLGTICLPSRFKSVPVGTTCYFTGWGFAKKTATAKPFLQLQETAMPVVDQDVCRALNTRKAPILITPRMLCAGYGPGDVRMGCHSDNGSPLVCHVGNQNHYTLHGIASWGSTECSSNEVYTVFTRVSKLRRWIDTQIADAD